MYRKILPPAVFIFLLLSALYTGHHSYVLTKEAITADLNHALSRTLQDKGLSFISADTIQTYKAWQQCTNKPIRMAIADRTFCENLKDRRLKDLSYVSFAIVDRNFQEIPSEAGTVCGDTLLLRNKATNDIVALRSYACLSWTAILHMSDQSSASLLAVLALLWITSLYAFTLLRKPATPLTRFGNIYFSDKDSCFYDSQHAPLSLTPMQFQLLRMFWAAPQHTLTKDEICTTLWPKKELPDDSLYTLIKRLKSTLSSCSNLKIASQRGKSYSLEIN